MSNLTPDELARLRLKANHGMLTPEEQRAYNDYATEQLSAVPSPPSGAVPPKKGFKWESEKVAEWRLKARHDGLDENERLLYQDYQQTLALAGASVEAENKAYSPKVEKCIIFRGAVSLALMALIGLFSNCLVFIHIGDAAAGVCHYVNADFVGMKGKTSCAYNDHINEAIGLFLASVITANNASRYSFSQSWTGKSLLDTEILLPATPSGDPDWDYMDEYMSGVMEEAKASLENMGKVEKELHSADISGWKRFTIGSLFEIEKGTRLTRAAMIDGDTPFIGATLENNGITARVGNTGHVHPGGLMTVAYNGQKATGKAFYQPIPFWASDDVNVLYPKFSLTENIALFLAPLFWEAGRPYSFGDKWGKDVMENDCLVLPVNASSDPDWAYVDEYMRDVMERAQSDLSTMQSIG